MYGRINPVERDVSLSKDHKYNNNWTKTERIPFKKNAYITLATQTRVLFSCVSFHI